MYVPYSPGQLAPPEKASNCAHEILAFTGGACWEISVRVHVVLAQKLAPYSLNISGPFIAFSMQITELESQHKT